MQPTPRLSVLTIGADYPDIDHLLEALARQTAGPESFEVVLADSRAARWEAAAREALRRHPSFQLTYLRGKAGHKWRAQLNNEAIRHSRGEVLLFLAGDFIPDPGLVAAHSRFHAEHPEREVVGIGAGYFPPAQLEAPLVRWLESSGQLFGAKLKDELTVPPDFFYVGNSSLKRRLLLEAGLFDEDFQRDTWDDYELGIRLLQAGSHSHIVAGAVASHEHEHPITLRERMRSMRYSGEAAALFERKHSGPYPWARKCAFSARELTVRAWRARLRHLASRSPADLERFFANILDAAFVAGYRHVRRRGEVK